MNSWLGCSVTQHLPHSAVRSGEMKMGEDLWESPGPWAFPHMCKRVVGRAVYFSSLIPKMSMLTLAISCLTTSSLPWFVDLTFQVPMQYCSIQHQTLLPSPVTSTSGCCSCFGSIPSFFLELFLHSSPVAYWLSTDLGSSSFVSYLFALSYF